MMGYAIAAWMQAAALTAMERARHDRRGQGTVEYVGVVVMVLSRGSSRRADPDFTMCGCATASRMNSADRRPTPVRTVTSCARAGNGASNSSASVVRITRR